MAIRDIQGETKRVIEVTCDAASHLRRVPLEDLQRFQGALKSLGEDQYRKLKDSIAKHGFFVPVFVWRNKILDGHQRLLVIEKEKWAVQGGVPVVDIEAETESDAAEKLLLISSTYGKIEPQGLYDFTELHDIPLTVSDLPDLPDFDLEGFKNAFYEEEEEDEGAADDVPDVPEVPVSQTGDLWLLGGHRLLCGDSTSGEDVARLMGGVKADMVFTDPPYGMEYGGGRAAGSTAKGALLQANGMIIGDDLKGDDLLAMVADSISNAIMGAKSGVASYICFTWRTYAEFHAALNSIGLKPSACIVWDKKSIGLGRSDYRPQHEFIFYCSGQWHGDKAQSDVWYMSRGGTGQYVHPTQKPVELIEKGLLNSSKGGDVIHDCFGGSGSTLIACEKTNRNAYLMELDPKYCDVIVKRWEDFTGKKARLEDGGRTFGEVAEERSGTNKLEDSNGTGYKS